MAITANSRYATAKKAVVIMPDGSRRAYIYARQFPSVSLLNTESADSAVSDTLDSMASRYYGRETYWWIIADINGIVFPEVDETLPSGYDAFFPGRNLVVPALTGAASG